MLLVAFTIAVAFVRPQPQHFVPLVPPEFGPPGPAIMAGAAQIFFIFAGYDEIAMGGEEVRHSLAVTAAWCCNPGTWCQVRHMHSSTGWLESMSI